MGEVISSFILSAPIEESAPYFEGFCGEHQLYYPCVVQLAGSPQELDFHGVVGMSLSAILLSPIDLVFEGRTALSRH